MQSTSKQLKASYNRNWRQNHRDRCCEYSKKYRLENKEKIIAYRLKTKERKRFLDRMWLRTLKGKLKVHRERMRKLNVVGSHTCEEWEKLKALCGFQCLMCLKKEPEIKLTKDHIIPVSLGGADYIENIQPLCRPCNSKKLTGIVNLKEAYLQKGKV